MEYVKIIGIVLGACVLYFIFANLICKFFSLFLKEKGVAFKNEEEKEAFLHELIKANTNDEYLMQASSRNGCGSNFYEILSIEYDNIRFDIHAKYNSSVFIPLIKRGYLLCAGSRILSTIPTSAFNAIIDKYKQ